jgi:hypothetical protein
MDMIEGSNSLADLAARINAEHEAVLHSMKSGLEHAIVAGNLLSEAKAHVPHDHWLPWLREHCPIPERTASHYMRLVRHADELEEKSANLADLTVTDAVELLAPIAPPPKLMESFLIALSEIDPRIVVLPTGVHFPEDLTPDAWMAVGNLLHAYFPARD